ncbi:hypothetical protein PMIN03_009911 [Paraphaeosphaeria minitans]
MLSEVLLQITGLPGELLGSLRKDRPKVVDRAWRALVVDEVQKHQLRWSQDGEIDTQALPTELIHVQKDILVLNHALPVDVVNVSASHNVRSMAVLSWRWDVEPNSVSRNLLSAVLYARHAGIKYLFIDIVSIDQSLHKDDLLNEVCAFSQLYSTLSAIKAYGKSGEAMSVMNRRPWIYHEQQLIKRSAHRAVNVRHSTKFSKWNEGVDLMARSFDRTFFQTAVLMLHGTVGLTDLADFRFLMPAIAGSLMRWYEVMTQNDYLLTVAILSALNDPHKMWAPSSAKIQHLTYQRYAFKRWTGGCGYDVVLDEEKIATWWTLIPHQLKKFQLVDGAREVVSKRLGVALDDIVALGLGQRTRIPLNVSSTVRSLVHTFDKYVEDHYFWVDLEKEIVSKEMVSMMLNEEHSK